MSEETAPIETGQADPAPVESGQATTWYTGANDETVGYIQNKGWSDDPLKAITSYQELEKFRGASEDELMKFPKDIGEDGVLDDIYTRLGKPETHDKYTVELPEGVQIDDNRLNAAREAAHKEGLSQKQFEAMAQFDAEYGSKAMLAMNEENAKQQEVEYQNLQKEWGSNAAEREELARRQQFL